MQNDKACSKIKKIKNKKRYFLDSFQTATKNRYTYQNKTDMSTWETYVISSDTNVHFASVIHAAY